MIALNKTYSKINSLVEAIPPIAIARTAFFLILIELLILLLAAPVFYRDSSEYLAVTDAFRLSHWEIAFPQHLPVLYTFFAGLLTKLHVPTVSALLFVSGFFTEKKADELQRKLKSHTHSFCGGNVAVCDNGFFAYLCTYELVFKAGVAGCQLAV